MPWTVTVSSSQFNGTISVSGRTFQRNGSGHPSHGVGNLATGTNPSGRTFPVSWSVTLGDGTQLAFSGGTWDSQQNKVINGHVSVTPPGAPGSDDDQDTWEAASSSTGEEDEVVSPQSNPAEPEKQYPKLGDAVGA